MDIQTIQASAPPKGLFHGAISQSGGSFGPPRPTTFPGENLKRLADAESAGEGYATSAGASSIANLRKLAPDKLPRGRGWPIIDDNRNSPHDASNGSAKDIEQIPPSIRQIMESNRWGVYYNLLSESAVFKTSARTVETIYDEGETVFHIAGCDSFGGLG